MAQLTYSEKAEMAAKSTFQQRVWTALKDHAKYWIEFNSADAAALYNAQIQKRKRYAKTILSQAGLFGDQKAVCEFLLNLYNVDPPVLDENGELADSELGTSSSSAALTFDAFAGIIPGDNDNPIQW